MRLRTIFSFIVRLTKQPFVAGGREYPAGVMLCPCNHLVHRRADLYPDPHTFRPERFIERRFAGHEWFPFGGGNRTCLGAGFALYQMKITLATLLARLRLSRPRSAHSAVVRQGVSLAPKDGVVVSVHARAGGMRIIENGEAGTRLELFLAGVAENRDWLFHAVISP